MSVPLNISEWDDFVASFEQRHPENSFSTHNAHILQTSAWANLKCEFGWSATRVVARLQGKAVAGAQMLFRPLPLGLGTIAYVPKGPLVNWSDSAQSSYLLSLCDEIARANRAWFMIIEPDLVYSKSSGIILEKLGLLPSKESIQPTRTIVINLNQDLETILSNMKQKTRYNIRLSQRKGVSVRIATPATINDDLFKYQSLLETTSQRNNFGVHSSKYYKSVYDLFAPSGQVALLIAEYNGKPLASLMIFAYGGRAWYFYGSSSGDERNRMPTYALQWAAIGWAKEKGCHSYDLWGVPNEDLDVLESEFADRQDGLWPVYRFKRGFGGKLYRSVGAWEKIYSPWAHRLYRRLKVKRSGA